MPRRNKTATYTKKTYTAPEHRGVKKAYASKSEAERAARETEKYNMDVKLYAYRPPNDGKWYLSSQK